ncbi:MAG: hypothetical protein KA841_02150 [Chitinophagales bacterium]|nr:hypothetical protein [Chitinophagales bacterium]
MHGPPQGCGGCRRLSAYSCSLFSNSTGGAVTDPAKTITVQPGNSDAVLVLDMEFSEAKPYLNVFNPNAATGKWGRWK